MLCSINQINAFRVRLWFDLLTDSLSVPFIPCLVSNSRLSLVILLTVIHFCLLVFHHHSLFHSTLKTSLFCKSLHRSLPFYRAMLCSRGTSHGPVSVRLSVTSRCSTKTAKRRITQTTPHDSAGTLVFWCQRSPQNSTGSPPTRAPNAGGVGQNRRLSTNNRLYLENGTR